MANQRLTLKVVQSMGAGHHREKGGIKVNKKLCMLYVLISLCIPFQALYAAMEENSALPWAKWSVRAGGFFTTLDTNIRLGIAQVNTDIDMEDALGVDSLLWALRADATYRFSRNLRHRFDLSYAGYFRSTSEELQEDLVLEDDTIETGSIVRTTFNMQIIKLVYNWSFFMDDRVDLGIGGGIYIMPITLEIDPENEGSKVTNITAPLPVLGLHMDFAITPKWYFRQKHNLFYLAINEYKGSILDMEMDVEYRFWKYAGVGLGINAFRVSIVDMESSVLTQNFNGKIASYYIGLLLYAKFYY